MIQEGDKVIVIKSGLRGVVRYVGETEFKSGLWIGLELELRRGKNDGSVRDVRYFECRPDYGLFLREQSVRIVSRAAAAAVRSTSSSSSSSFEARGRLFYFSSETRSWISKGDVYATVGNGTLTMKKERLLIEYNIDDITKIEPSMGSQGKAWVFNVMSGESDDDDDDEIVYVVFYISFEYCENFNSRFEHSDTR